MLFCGMRRRRTARCTASNAAKPLRARPEREMIELLVSMSNAMSTAVRVLAEELDSLRAVVDGIPDDGSG